jgi:hypothetical protein
MNKPCAAAVLALALAIVPLEATALESPDSVRPTMGVLIESQLNPDLDSKVSTPSINFNLGAGLNFPFAPESRFSFAPSGNFYFYYGEFNHGQPVSADQGFSSTYIVGLLVDAPVMYTLPLGSSDFTLRTGLGLCLDLRFALKSGDIPASDTEVSESADVAAADSNKYFWGKGRFITPSTTVNVEYTLNDRMGVGLSTRVLWPVYNLWTNEGYGFFDQTKYLIDIVIRYKLKPKGEPSSAPADSAPADAAPTENPAPAREPAGAAPPAPPPAAAQ